MSASISFSQISPNLRIPLVAVEFDNSQAGAAQQPQRTLIIGDSYHTIPIAPTYIPSPAYAANLYGPRALIAQMIAAYLANDPLAQLYAVAYPQVSDGTQATGSIAIAGTASAAGTLAVYIAGTPIAVAVAKDALAADVATALAAAINAQADVVAVSATAATGTVTVTALAKGASQNDIDIRLNYYGAVNNEAVPAGLTVVITAMSGGAGVPDLSGLDAMLGDQNFRFIVAQYDDSVSRGALTALMNNSSGRWAPTRKDWGHVWNAHADTSTNLLTFAATENDPHRTTVGLNASPTSSWVIAAAAAGAAAPALRADPARPVQTLPVIGVLAPSKKDQFTKPVKNTLLSTGIAQLTFDDAGDCFWLRAVTNYTQNVYGQADQSYLDTETLYTLMAITDQLDVAISTKFARSKLADDGTRYGAGQPIVTPAVMKSEIDAQYALMELAGLVEDADAMAAATVVARNAADPSRIDILWAPFLVSGLRIVAIKNQFRLLSAAILAGLTS